MQAINDITAAWGQAMIEWSRPNGEEWAHDAPTKDWPLANFTHAFWIMVIYLSFVFIGSKVMSKDGRKPVQGLYGFKFIYNLTQMMLCSWMCIEALIRAYQAGYFVNAETGDFTVLPCVPFDNDNQLPDPPIAFVLYVFYLSKILDFADTVFIILSQKWDQLSFLHVYHHTSIFMFYWLNLNVGYDGDVYMTIVLNGLVHTVMYTYYFVAMHPVEKTKDKYKLDAAGKTVMVDGKPVIAKPGSKDIWWKSYLTKFQLVQFVMMMAQSGYMIHISCKNYSAQFLWTYGVYILSMFLLFSHFYVKSYIFPSKKADPAAATAKEHTN